MEKTSLFLGLVIGLLVGAILGYGSLSAQLSAKDAALKNLQSQISQLQSQVSQLTDSLTQKDQEISSLQNEINQLSSENNELKSKVSALEEEKTQLQQENTNLKNQVTALESENTDLKTQITTLQNQVTNLQTQLANIENTNPRLIAVSFSRYEDTRSLLINWISRANKSIYVMVMCITADELADSLIDAYNRGINVTIIIDDMYKTSKGSDYEEILNAGIDIRSDNSWRLMHHKVMIIDGYIIVTGSYNWSASAEDKNWENIVILRSQSLANYYLEEFQRIWSQTTLGE